MKQALGFVATYALVAAMAAQEPVERVTQITFTGSRNGQSFFSPDGERISFVSNRRDGWQVWVTRRDGTEPLQITAEPNPVGWPSWSPDGGTIHFYAEREGRYRLLQVDLENRTATLAERSDWPSFRPLFDATGQRMLFDAYEPESERNHDLFVYDTGSGELRRLTRTAAYESDARWSPDGEWIAFHSDQDRAPLHTAVFVMAADGTNRTVIADGDAFSGYPSWSPNGQCIVFISERDDNRDLWVAGRDGSDPERLTRHSGFDGDPVWDPRGGRILFTTARFGGQELAFLAISDHVARRCEE